MCLSKMIFKEAKNALCALIAFSFLFSSTTALSANPILQKHVQHLNENQSVWTYAESMKLIFKTQEDEKQIDKMAKELEGPTKKWLWRLEFETPDSIAFRVNGKVQAVIKNYDPETNSFVLNGQKIAIKNGESFLSFKTNFVNAFNKKTVSLDSLFFSEAQAFFWVPFLAVLGVGAMAAHAASTPQDPMADFKKGSMCNSNQMPQSHNRRVIEVRKNFKPNMKFNGRMNTQHRFEMSCFQQYSPVIGAEGAVARCKCIYRKQLDCSAGGYNMTPYGATNLCIEAQTGQKTTPYPQTPTGYQPIPTKDYKSPAAGTGSGYPDSNQTPYQPIPTGNYKEPVQPQTPYGGGSGNAEGRTD